MTTEIPRFNIISLSNLNHVVSSIPRTLRPISEQEHAAIQEIVQHALFSQVPVKICKRDFELKRSILILEDKTPVLLISTKESFIGQGGNNLVSWGIHLTTGQVLAVSRYRFYEKKPTSESEINTTNELYKENFNITLENLRNCQGARIVHLLGDFASTNRYGIIRQKLILEYCEGGDLKNALPRLSTAQKHQIVSDLLEGVAYIHSQGVTHSDLKPANILLSHDMRAKVTDFDLASMFNMEEGFPGTANVLPPELALHKKFVHEKVDAWALGLIFFEMLSSKDGFYNLSQCLFLANGKMNPNITQNAIDHWIKESTPPLYHDLLKSLLQIDPSKRSSVQDAHRAWHGLPAKEAPKNSTSFWDFRPAAIAIAILSIFSLWVFRDIPK